MGMDPVLTEDEDEVIHVTILIRTYLDADDEMFRVFFLNSINVKMFYDILILGIHKIIYRDVFPFIIAFTAVGVESSRDVAVDDEPLTLC